MSLTLTSTAFGDGSEIPLRYTADGENVSPPLSWAGAPANAKSLVLIAEDPDAPDPDAPQGTWTHWVLYNLPAQDSGLRQDAASAGLPSGAKPGLNDWKRAGYGGPQPPIGRHRYFFRLYALDTTLPDLNTPDRSALEDAMHDHVVDSASLLGTYQH